MLSGQFSLLTAHKNLHKHLPAQGFAGLMSNPTINLVLLAAWLLWGIFSVFILKFFFARLTDAALDEETGGGTTSWGVTALLGNCSVCCLGNCYLLLHWIIIIAIVLSFGLVEAQLFFAGSESSRPPGRGGKLVLSLVGHLISLGCTIFTLRCHRKWKDICAEESMNYMSAQLENAQAAVTEKSTGNFT